jgi:7-cyano-7-deazaguanine synthase
MSKSVILLSGGLDSAVTAWVAKESDRELYALSFDYGQRHIKEIKSACALGWELNVREHKVLPLPNVGGSSLVGVGDIPVSGLTEKVPSTWVPQRNAIFLAFAFGWAEVVGADKVYIGVNSVDYSGYPDCRPEFINSAEQTLRLASKQFVETGAGIQIFTPIINLTKKEIVLLGLKLGVPFQLTWSCYKGEERACGVCDSCRIRRKAFRDNGIEDPIEYQET